MLYRTGARNGGGIPLSVVFPSKKYRYFRCDSFVGIIVNTESRQKPKAKTNKTFTRVRRRWTGWVFSLETHNGSTIDTTIETFEHVYRFLFQLYFFFFFFYVSV